jgi:hypothetical protein
VIAPAKTGSDSTSKNTVMNTDHTKSLICSKEIETLRKFLTVHIKLILPKIELTPAQ